MSWGARYPCKAVSYEQGTPVRPVSYEGGAPVRPGRDGLRMERPRGVSPSSRKVDIRLPGKGNSNSHGARPVY